ncbi:MAG TPA: hypothetical protein VGH42_09885 [Verrucomicrobiae bacterium]
MRIQVKAESVFDTFPWPQTATVKQIDAVAAAARELRRVRAEALSKIKGGLRALYRTLEFGFDDDLRQQRQQCLARIQTRKMTRLRWKKPFIINATPLWTKSELIRKETT